MRTPRKNQSTWLARTALFAVIVCAVAVGFWLEINKEGSAPTASSTSRDNEANQSGGILIVIDAQKDFWMPEVETAFPKFESRIAGLLRKCRENSMEVVHIRTEYDDQLRNWAQDFLPVHQTSELCLAGTEGAEPLTCASEADGERVFLKGNIDAFSNAEFVAHLSKANCQKLLICGLYTDVCVLSTGLSAFNRGYDVTIVQDCCASTRSMHDFVINRYGNFVFSLKSSDTLSFF